MCLQHWKEEQNPLELVVFFPFSLIEFLFALDGSPVLCSLYTVRFLLWGFNVLNNNVLGDSDAFWLVGGLEMRGSLLQCTVTNYHSEFLLIWKHLGAANTQGNLIVRLGSAFQGLMAGARGALTRQVMESKRSSFPWPQTQRGFSFILPYWFLDYPISKLSFSSQGCIHTPSEQRLNPLRMPLVEKWVDWALRNR